MSARKRNAFRGFTADIGGTFFIQLLSMAAIPFYLKYIAVSDYGYWLVIISIIGWIGLADFGIGFAVTRFFIKGFSSQEDIKESSEINEIANTSLLLFTGIAVFFLSVGLLLLPFFPKWFHVEHTTPGNFLIAFIIVLINTTISIPFSVFSAILEAKQKIALNRNIQTLNLSIQLLSSVLLVFYYKNIVALSVGLLPGTIISSVLLYYYANKELTISFSKKYINKAVSKQLFSFGGYFQAGRTANIIATNTDSLFIVSYLGVEKVPVYNFTSKLPMLFCNTIASKIAGALFSGLSQVFDQGDHQLFKKTFRKLFNIIVRIAFFSSIMNFFLNEKFVDLWVGSNNFGGWKLNLIFVYWVFFETIIRGTGTIIQLSRSIKTWALFSVFEAVSNIGLSFYFLYIGWGIAGLALATAVARTFTIGIYWLWFFQDKSLINPGEVLFSFINNALTSLPLILILFLISRFIKFNHIAVDLVICSIIGFAVNLLSYDWKILLSALKKRSVKTLYSAYLEKY